MDPIALHAARQPAAPAIVEARGGDGSGDRVVSWRELATRRDRLARALAGRGFRPGEHAVVYAANSIEVLLAGAAVRAASRCR